MADCYQSQIYLSLDLHQLRALKSGKAEKLTREEWKYLEGSLVRKCAYSMELEHFLKP